MLLFCILLFCGYGFAHDSCMVSVKDDVVLQISLWHQMSEVVCLNRTDVEIKENHISAISGVRVGIICASRGPIEFFFEAGSNSDSNTISPWMDIALVRDLDNHFASRAQGYVSQENVGKYGCRSMNNTKEYNSVYIYASNNAPPYLLNRGATIDIVAEEDVVLFPCRCGDAYEKVNFWKVDTLKGVEEMGTLENTLWYDRTQGFYMNLSSTGGSNHWGQYLCTTQYRGDLINFNLHFPRGFRISPNATELSLKSWNSLKLECATQYAIAFTWDAKDLSQSAVKITTLIQQNKKLKFVNEFLLESGSLSAIKNIAVSCGSLHTWNIKINSDGVHPNDLKLNLSGYPYPIECTSPSVIPKLEIMACENRLQCHMQQKCFEKVMTLEKLSNFCTFDYKQLKLQAPFYATDFVFSD